MFDLIFDMVCGDEWDIMVIVTDDGCLYGVPCEYNSASNCETLWEKKVKLSSMKVDGLTEFHHSGTCKRYGLLIEKDRTNNELHICCAEDDWGGFVSVQDYDLSN